MLEPIQRISASSTNSIVKLSRNSRSRGSRRLKAPTIPRDDTGGSRAVWEGKTRYSRGSRVDVVEASKDWPGDDRSGGAERTRSGRMQIQTSVAAIPVVISRALPEQPDQMALVDHDDVVQAFPAEGPPAIGATLLRDRVVSRQGWAAYWRSQRPSS
jgi:hypothetical protein